MRISLYGTKANACGEVLPFPSKKQRAFGSRVHSSAGVLILQIREEELRRQELLYPLTCIFDVIYVSCSSFLC